MSYLALARRWRPRRFSDLVGQGHVVRALTNALDADRLHHAFLFTGTRGVGKTTVARILARCIDCERGVGSQPCGECQACREIDEGRFVDLIEVDAASRTGVDDTRELLDNVQYAPTVGRYKVYLIDEVHMLSNHSFNALLRSLEEPPPHVKFLLATTDPQKIPATVLSRCLQFSLKRLPTGLIRDQLRQIAEGEGVTIEDGAVTELARAADGSMRDALSLMDQAVAFTAGTLTEAWVAELLGTIDRDRVSALFRALSAGDGQALIEALEALEEHAPDYAAVLDEMARALQRAALVQQLGRAVEEDDRRDAVASELSERLEAEDIQLFYEIALLGRRDLPLAPDPRGGFEMTMLRMLSFRPEDGSAGAAEQPGGRSAGSGAPAVASGPDAGPSESAGVIADGDAADAAGTDAPPSDWLGIVEALALRGAAHQLAVNCTLASHQGHRMVLHLDERHGQLKTPGAEQRLQDALQGLFGDPELKLTVELASAAGETPAQRAAEDQARRQAEAARAIEADPNVQALQERFGATVNGESIRPVADDTDDASRNQGDSR